MKSFLFRLSLLCCALLLAGMARQNPRLSLAIALNQGTQLPTEPRGGSTQPLEPMQARPQAPRPPGEFTQQDPQAVPRQTKHDPAKIKEDARKLSTLANQISAEVDKVSQGTLPKELLQHLKEIQKVAKQLRGEIAP